MRPSIRLLLFVNLYEFLTGMQYNDITTSNVVKNIVFLGWDYAVIGKWVVRDYGKTEMSFGEYARTLSTSYSYSFYQIRRYNEGEIS